MQADIIQTLMGAISSLAFAILFGVRNRKALISIVVGSAIGWAAYIVCQYAGYGKTFGMLASGLTIAAWSEILARIIKTPVVVMLGPMLIPEFPGGGLYYAMYSLIEGDTAHFGETLKLVLAEAGAIALGIIIAAYVAGFLTNLRKAYARKQHS